MAESPRCLWIRALKMVRDTLMATAVHKTSNMEYKKAEAWPLRGCSLKSASRARTAAATTTVSCTGLCS